MTWGNTTARSTPGSTTAGSADLPGALKLPLNRCLVVVIAFRRHLLARASLGSASICGACCVRADIEAGGLRLLTVGGRIDRTERPGRRLLAALRLRLRVARRARRLLRTTPGSGTLGPRTLWTSTFAAHDGATVAVS